MRTAERRECRLGCTQHRHNCIVLTGSYLTNISWADPCSPCPQAAGSDTVPGDAGATCLPLLRRAGPQGHLRGPPRTPTKHDVTLQHARQADGSHVSLEHKCIEEGF